MASLVVAEHDNIELKRATLHAVTAASQFEGEVHILVAGADSAAVAAAAAAKYLSSSPLSPTLSVTPVPKASCTTMPPKNFAPFGKYAMFITVPDATEAASYSSHCTSTELFHNPRATKLTSPVSPMLS